MRRVAIADVLSRCVSHLFVDIGINTDALNAGDVRCSDSECCLFEEPRGVCGADGAFVCAGADVGAAGAVGVAGVAASVDESSLVLPSLPHAASIRITNAAAAVQIRV